MSSIFNEIKKRDVVVTFSGVLIALILGYVIFKISSIVGDYAAYIGIPILLLILIILVSELRKRQLKKGIQWLIILVAIVLSFLIFLIYFSIMQRVHDNTQVSFALYNTIVENESTHKAIAEIEVEAISRGIPIKELNMGEFPQYAHPNSTEEAIRVGREICDKERVNPIIIWKDSTQSRVIAHLTLINLLFQGISDFSFFAEPPNVDIRFYRSKVIPIFYKAYLCYQDKKYDQSLMFLDEALAVVNGNQYEGQNSDKAEILNWKGHVSYVQMKEKSMNDPSQLNDYYETYFKNALIADSLNFQARYNCAGIIFLKKPDALSSDESVLQKTAYSLNEQEVTEFKKSLDILEKIIKDYRPITEPVESPNTIIDPSYDFQVRYYSTVERIYKIKLLLYYRATKFME